MDQSAPRGMQGRKMMERKLRLYLWWKGKLSERKQGGKGPFALPDSSHEALDRDQTSKGSGDGGEDIVSEALKRKDQMAKERGASRRRVRGGAPGKMPAVARKEKKGPVIEEGEMRDEAATIADL